MSSPRAAGWPPWKRPAGAIKAPGPADTLPHRRRTRSPFHRRPARRRARPVSAASTSWSTRPATLSWNRPPTVCEERWSSLMDTNLNGALRACQSFYEPLKAQRPRTHHQHRLARVATWPSTEVAAYCAAKSALLSLTRSLACEWARDGIVVNAIAPGVFPTEMNSEHGQRHGPRARNCWCAPPWGASAGRRNWSAPPSCYPPTPPVSSPGQCIAVDGGYLASGVNS